MDDRTQPWRDAYRVAVVPVKEQTTVTRRIAAELLAGAPRTLTQGATYFHTAYVRPSWTRRFIRTARIGSHVFYRRGGGARIASN